ncbi:MAG: hypothetical protein BGP06_07185 [Rhizobiales bacterium 65-9]|nr:hypothetical protein [Hyphomicrobiales bacterium]OJY35752.1 MAG: hypothetical protein BGP06_07185 [Rhizobiales bacterium 65-9]
MTGSWRNKHGVWRVRHEPPTVQEAIAAAEGLADDLESQVDIASSLMGVTPEVVRAEISKMRRLQTTRQTVIPSRFAAGPRGAAPRAVVVQRVPSRRPTARPAI